MVGRDSSSSSTPSTTTTTTREKRRRAGPGRGHKGKMTRTTRDRTSKADDIGEEDEEQEEEEEGEEEEEEETEEDHHDDEKVDHRYQEQGNRLLPIVLEADVETPTTTTTNRTSRHEITSPSRPQGTRYVTVPISSIPAVITQDEVVVPKAVHQLIEFVSDLQAQLKFSDRQNITLKQELKRLREENSKLSAVKDVVMKLQSAFSGFNPDPPPPS